LESITEVLVYPELALIHDADIANSSEGSSVIGKLFPKKYLGLIPQRNADQPPLGKRGGALIFTGVA